MNYIDELWNRTKDNLSYDDLKNIEASGRAPAAKPFVGPPKELQGVQQEKETEVSGDSQVKPVEYPAEYKMTMPQSEIFRENANRALQQRAQDKSDFAQNAQDAYKKQQEQEIQLGNAVNKITSATEPYKRAGDLSTALQKAQNDVDNMEQVPKRDLMSELILSLGPAVFAGLGGETAAISAPKGGQQARTIYDTNRKEEENAVEKRNKLIQDKYEKLLKIDESAANDWINKQKLNLDQGKAEVDAIKFGIGTNQKDVQKSQDLANQAARDYTQGAIHTSEGVMKNETLPYLEEGKNKRAALAATTAGIRTSIPSSDERKAASYLSTVQRANQSLQQIGGPDQRQFPSLKNSMFSVESSLLGGRMGMGEFLESQVKDPAVRAQLQAESDWVSAKLRRESGAAISVAEFKSESNRYFPRKGDSDQVIAQKAAARKQVELGLAQEAGRATPPALAKTEPLPPPVQAPDVKGAVTFDLPKMTYSQKLDAAFKAGKITKEQYEAGKKKGK